MADLSELFSDINLMQDDDDYSKYYESYKSSMDQTNPDDLLSPLEKLRKYCTSDNIFTRQMVARSIIETVQSVQNQQECLSLLEIITKLADDFEPSVRCELMEQLPPCSLMIMDMRLVPDAIAGFILPVMVKFLADANNQVRKLSQNALLQLVDQEMIQREEVEQQICPVLLTLTEPDSGDDFRTEAVTLMTKIAPLIGNEATERSFLKRFGDLCTDPLFHVRKVCASNFGDMSSVLNQDTIEEHLIPLFARLCEDGVWGVRKACAETFMAVSGTCSRNVRYHRLAPLFVGLLSDKSRWVQMAAYQALGPFIATFAEPERSGYDVDEDGMLVRCKKIDTSTLSNGSDDMPQLEDPSLESDRLTHLNDSDGTATDYTTEQNFNNFEYWRTPLPPVDIPDDDEINDAEEDSTSRASNDPLTPTKSNIDDALEHQRSEAVSPRSSVMTTTEDDFLHVDPTGEGFHSDSDNDDNSPLHHNTSVYTSSLVGEESLQRQTIVPSALLEHYISMTEPNKIQTIDGELPRHCAFTLPGVVLALGSENWHLLKETYEILSTDMQWKVRRTLASSIHDLAIILGEEICVRDLLPVFNGLVKDLDVVRIGVLKHLYDFISFLPNGFQKDCLQLFSEFHKTDNRRNWRYRQELALQLMNLTTLYDDTQLAEYVCPIALDLACDKVAEIRQNAFHLMCILMQKLVNGGDEQLIQKFVTNIITMATHHQHWVKRKSCAQIYLRSIEGQWYESGRFAKDFLPSLITLCSDNVPNVRLIAAQTILSFMKTEYFESLPEDDEVRKSVSHAIESLQTDDDRDVRYFSGGKMNDVCFQFSENAEVDYDQRFQSNELGGGVRMIERGIHEYALNDGDDDSELVEEVYIEEHSSGDSNDIIIEEYYIDEPRNTSVGEQRNIDYSPHIFVEEIVEEIIETIGDQESSDT